MKSLLLFVLSSLLTICSVISAPVVKILFVGNSLTYTNDLPTLVERLAMKKEISVKTDILAFANYALEDHWVEGKLQVMIESGHYDYVVVQQGPSSQREGKLMLDDYGSRIQKLCLKYSARLVFYMVWPARANYHMFEGVIKNYTEAAQQNQALLCPVGKVWKEHFEQTNDFSYYGPDDFHPSMAGSQVAAEVIVKTLFP